MTDQQTLDLYSTKAHEYAAQYEQGQRQDFQARLLNIFPQGSTLLEIGCGSGADAACLLRNGRQILATDASAEMLTEAVKYHPELKGNTLNLIWPARLVNISDHHFDGIFSTAVLMHFQRPALIATLTESSRVLKIGGTFMLGIFDARDDLDTTGRDRSGRYYELPKQADLMAVFSDAGFKCTRTYAVEDALGRAGMKQREYVFEKIV